MNGEWLPIHDAAEVGNLHRVKILIEEYPRSVDRPAGLWGRTPLHLACEGGHLDVVEYLLEHGADAINIGRDGWGPLHFAARKGQVAIIKKLLSLDCGINVNCSEQAEQPLHLALRSRQVEIVKILIDAGANVNTPGRNDIPGVVSGRLPMFYAIKAGDVQLLKILHDAGAPWTVNNSGLSALHLASKCGQVDVIQYLLDCCQDLNSRDPQRDLTPLHVAVEERQVDSIKCLLKGGADINVTNIRGYTPLLYATTVEVAELLLENGARINVITTDNETLPNLLLLHDRLLKIVYILLKHGATVNSFLGGATSRTGIDPFLRYFLTTSNFSEEKRVKRILNFFEFMIESGFPINQESWLSVYSNASDTDMNADIIFDWLKSHYDQVPPLRRVCVSVIRQQISSASGGTSILKRIEALPLPDIVKDLISLKQFWEKL